MERDEIEVAIDRIKLILKDFSLITHSKPIKNRGTRLSGGNIDSAQFPSPQLILFVLNGLLRLPEDSTSERTHWQVNFTFKKFNCAIALKKFGLKLYVPEDCNEVVVRDQLLGKLKKAIVSAEKNILSEYAKIQIDAGNVSIANRFLQLDGQYKYFRETAQSNFELKAKLSGKSDSALGETVHDMGKAISTYLNQMTGKDRNGSFNAMAMIDAYFSRLENFLVIALGFSSFNREVDHLTTYVGSIWSKKWERIFNIKDKESNSYLAELASIKEKYRNTFAHGGFEKKGASFYFHLDNFGAIPASMSEHSKSVHFNVFPISENSFTNICTLFDSVDEWLAKHRLPYAWKFAESGLDLRFDETHIQEILRATDSLEFFEQWIDHECEMQDRYDNADY